MVIAICASIKYVTSPYELRRSNHGFEKKVLGCMRSLLYDRGVCIHPTKTAGGSKLCRSRRRSFPGERRFQLLGTPISLGKPLPSVLLVDAMTMGEADLSQERGKVLFLSIVPSIDTRVCEAQTHYLGEEGGRLPRGVQRITISRDTPFAQKRFAREAKLTDIRYLSDYKEGEFGRSTGLLMDGYKLLARSVILVDKHGIVRYIQVIPEMTHLPDMEAAFQKAIELLKEE